MENIQTGIIEIEGNRYMRDARGALVPLSTIKAQDILMDETVRKIINYADDLSKQVARFRGHTFEDLNGFQSLLEQEYGAKHGGKKGNVTYMSYDGLLKVQVQIADQITFGPELQEAKSLLDELFIEWGSGSHEVLRAVVDQTFSVEKEGQINRADLFKLLRIECAEPRWKQAMEAIKDSIRVFGTKKYVRFYRRPAADALWQAITIDLAQVQS